jgi:hypothetical protein
MPPAGNTAPQPENRPRFSEKTIKDGNTIFDGTEGVDYFDENKFSLMVRIVMSAKRHMILSNDQKFENLPSELQSYLMFRINNAKRQEEDYYNIKILDEELKNRKSDEKYLLNRLHPEDDRDMIDALEQWERDNKA